MNDDDPKVVPLPQSRSCRLREPHRWAGRCEHISLIIDEHNRRTICRDCGAAVDPFEYMLAWAKREERLLCSIAALRAEEKDLRESIAALKRERANAKSARDRAIRKGVE